MLLSSVDISAIFRVTAERRVGDGFFSILISRRFEIISSSLAKLKLQFVKCLNRNVLE